jgi:hypothetical protein
MVSGYKNGVAIQEFVLDKLGVKRRDFGGGKFVFQRRNLAVLKFDLPFRKIKSGETYLH